MRDRIRKSLVMTLGVLMFVTLAATPALPQAAVGVITGRGMDASGALIPGVDVTISSNVMPGGDRNAITNESGVYRFTLLTPGLYTVTFALPGFATLIREEIRVTAGSTVTIDATLEVATVAETITVTGESPAVDLESAQVQTNFDEALLEELPSGRTLRSLMTNVPGFYARAIDVGGSGVGTGTQGSFRAYGRSGDTYFLTDGVYTGGHYTNFGAYSEIQIVPAGKGADVPNPGVYFNAVVRSGTNDVHGYIYSDYENDTFQSSNLTDELAAQGVEGRKFSRYHSHNGEIGGPIIRDRIWYYVSHYDAYNGEPIDGLTDEAGNVVDYYTRIADPTYKFTFQITDNNKLETMGEFGWKHQPYRSSNAFRPAEAARDQKSWSMLGNAKWQSILSPNATLDVQFSRWGYWWPSYANTRDLPLQTDLTTGYTRGSLNENYSKPTRWQWNTTLSLFTDAGQGNHEFKFGWGGWYYHYQDSVLGFSTHQEYDYRSNGDEADPKAGWPEAFAFFVQPNRVTVHNTPYRHDTVSTSNNFYINDRWNIVPRFTFNWGLRLDTYDSRYPAQGNAGLGPYAEAFTIPARDDFPAFYNWVPRLGFVLDLTGDGVLALKGSYGRYYGDMGRGLAYDLNPGRFGGEEKRYCAIGACPAGVPDAAAWDGTIPYVPDERARISTSQARDRRFDPDIKNDFVDEFALGLDFQLGNDYAGRVNVVRKLDRDGIQTINLALPYEAYTESITRQFEGQDYEIWSVPRSHPNFGERIDYRTNYPGRRSAYLGYEATLNKRMSDGHQFMVSWTQDYRQERCTRQRFSTFSGFNCSIDMPDNPNEELYDPSLRIWEWSFKVNGIYQLPYGMQFSGIFKSQSGQPYGREVRLRDANNSSQRIFIERDTYKTPKINLLDLRIQKRFQMGDRHSLDAMFDLFNTLNTSAPVALNLRSGSTFQRPTQLVPGRIFRLGARWTF